MSGGLLAIVAALYGWVALNYVLAGRHGMAIAFLAYALANIGFMLDLRQ